MPAKGLRELRGVGEADFAGDLLDAPAMGRTARKLAEGDLQPMARHEAGDAAVLFEASVDRRATDIERVGDEIDPQIGSGPLGLQEFPDRVAARLCSIGIPLHRIRAVKKHATDESEDTRLQQPRVGPTQAL